MQNDFHFEKHLRYLIEEAKRYLSQTNVTDADMVSLLREVELFKQRTESSEVNSIVKKATRTIMSGESDKKIEREGWSVLFAGMEHSIFAGMQERKVMNERRSRISKLNNHLYQLLILYHELNVKGPEM